MPKVINTRKQRASKLLTRIKNGPSFCSPTETMTDAIARYKYRIWADSWIINELVDLVPELRKAAKAEKK